MEWCYIGADPGVRGGLVAVHDMPKQPPWFLNLEGNDHREILRWLRAMERGSRSIYAVLEEIPLSIFGIKKSSMSKLYGSYTELRMALAAVGIPFSEVPPKVWLREFVEPRKKGESEAHWKNRHRDAARVLFDDGSISKDMSDAYLLSVYCKRLRLNQLSGVEDGKAA